MIRSRWAAAAAMACSLAAQGFALAQQTNSEVPATPQEAVPTTSGAIVVESPQGEAQAGGHIIIRMPDGKTRRINLPVTQGSEFQITGVNHIDVTARDEGDQSQVILLPKFVIGVSLSEVPDSLRAHLNLTEGSGVMVGAVVPDSPASKAGLQQYDLLLKSGDRELKVAKDLQEIVDASEGKVVSVTIQRKGEQKMIEFTPVKREDLKFTQTGEFNIPAPGWGAAYLMRSGDDPQTWNNLLASPQATWVAGGTPPTPMVTFPSSAPGPGAQQIQALTDSIRSLTEQIERLQKSVDRLEQRPGSETPKPAGEELKVKENGGALKSPRSNRMTMISLS